MARDRANVRIDIWADDDWRDLPGEAQLLYIMLLSHATLNYAGVADWRPGRLAAMSADGSVEAIEVAARVLQDRHFILVDETTEEVLVRSFVKHDGILKQPKLSVAMANAYAGVASKSIRSVIAYEVQKLHSRHPELSAWKAVQVQTMLDAKGSPIEAFTPAVTPRVTPAVTPKLDQSQALPTNTATNTDTEASLLREGAKLKAHRLPKDWAPTADHIKRAKENGLNLLDEVENFRLHAETHDRHAANWNGAFTTWLKKSRPTARPRVAANDEWMLR